MALIHWWPLNGDTKDYGLNPITLTNSNVTFDNAGKIGKAALFDSDSDKLSCNNGLAEISGFSKYSMCCWIYLTAQATNHSSSFLSSGDWNSGSAQVCFGLYNWNSGYGTLLVPNKSSWSTGISLSNRIQLNAWHHFAISYDGSTTKAYVDGAYVGSYNGGGISTTESAHYYLGAATYYNGFTMKGKMNDFRIYDHALTPKEIKEISKGLVLHYDFEDEEIEGTTNLITKVSSSNAKLPVAGNGVDLQTVSGDAYCDLALSTALTNGAVYTLSFTVSNMGTSDSCSFGFYDSSMHNTTPIHNGKNTITFTAWNTASHLTFDDGSRSNANVISLRDFQLEQKDHATPYVNGTRSSGTVYDSSGYGYNGASSGSALAISNSSSPMGLHYLKLNGNNDITTSLPILNTLINDKMTVAFWLYPITSISPGTGAFLTFGVASGDENVPFNLENTRWFCYNASNSPTIVANGLTLNQWHHITYTFDNKTIKRYINGSFTSSDTLTMASFKEATTLALGRRLGTNDRVSCYIADFKIYSTALSAADILKEYQSMANLDHAYNLTARQFVEDPTKTDFARLDHQGVFTAKALDESAFSTALHFKTYDNGDLVAREFKEN